MSSISYERSDDDLLERAGPSTKARADKEAHTVNRFHATIALGLAGCLLLFLSSAHAAKKSTYKAIAVTNGGTISGKVTFKGTVPTIAPLNVPKDKDFCGVTLPSDVLVVGKGGGLKNAVVSLRGVTEGKALDLKQAITLSNKKCMFEPHVVAVPVRSKLAIVNDDPILHNTHSFLGRKTVFNLALPNKGQVIKKRIKKTGVMTVRCDAHPHMSAYVLSFDHPYYTVTGENGSFTIKDIPPGTYTVTAWHEDWTIVKKGKKGRIKYGKPHSMSKKITIAGGKTATVDFEFSAK